MPDPATTETVIEQGRALVRAIEALGDIEPSGGLQAAVAGGREGRPVMGDRAAVWLSKN